jgi:hypothetical protein
LYHVVYPTASHTKAGYITVKAEDESYQVFSDGRFVGNTPAKLKAFEGNHLFEVKKPGWKDYRKEININDGDDLNLRAVLEK